MKNFNILLNNSFEIRFPNLDSILNQALQNTSEYLRQFRFDAGYTQKLETAFGNDFNRSVANQIFDKLAQGDFSGIPTIEIVNRNDINGANGAFAIATGKIYLASEFISQNAQNLDAVVAVLLEETGHYVDAKINTKDAAGDEGDIFARLVQGKSISQQELAVLKAEDDHATVTVDGQVVEIEQNNTNTTHTITYNKDTQQFNPPDFSIDRSQKTYFLIHGWQSSPDTFKTHGDLASSLESIDHKANIIYVDWSSVTTGFSVSVPYLSVVGQIPKVANALSKTFKTLNIDPNNTEIIGHSLGAHVAGGAGYVYSQTTSNKIYQVIGLDAAGVFNWTNGKDGRITTDSASNVVGIHTTNSGEQDDWLGRPGLGWYNAYGNKDIYIYKDGYLWGQSLGNDTWNAKTNHSYPIDLYSNLVKGQIYGSTSGNSSSDTSKFTNGFNLEFSSSPNGMYTVSVDNPMGLGRSIIGTYGDNNLSGTAGNDTIFGGAGNDTLNPGYSQYSTDIVDGGDGNDLLQVDYSSKTDGAGIDLIEKYISNSTDDRRSNPYILVQFSNIERFDITGTKYKDFIFGGAGSDTLNGGAGSDTLNGGAGDDILNPGYSQGSTDTVDGGDGNDLLQVDYSSKNNGAGIHLGYKDANKIYSRGGAGDNYELVNFSNIERFDITGTQYNDVFEGRSGNDTFNGGAGSDTLNGGAGDDILNPGYSQGSTDTVDGGDGNDLLQVDYSSKNNGAGIHLGYKDANKIYSRGGAGDNYELVNFSNIERFDITGTQYNDVFEGRSGNDTFNGGAGNDILVGDPANVTFGAAFTALTDFSSAQGWNSFDKYPRQLADVNGDGRADIVGFSSGAVHVALGQTDGKFGATKVAFDDSALFTVNHGGWSSFNSYPRQLGDVNGDGRADIVGFGSLGVVVALGQTDGTFQTISGYSFGNLSSAQGWNTFNQYPRQLADVNGDGRADIVGFGSYGVSVALGQANGTFGNLDLVLNDYTSGQGWNTFDQYPRQLADVNGDGTADIVGFGSYGVSVALANAGNDILTGGLGQDTLTGGAGRDRFDYRNLADSVLGGFDVITDFNAKSGNDLFVVSTTRSVFSNAGTVAALDATSIAAKLTNTTFTANSAAQFSFGSRTFVAINDATAGFDSAKDAIIEVTGLTGTLGLNNFTTTLA